MAGALFTTILFASFFVFLIMFMSSNSLLMCLKKTSEMQIPVPLLNKEI